MAMRRIFKNDSGFESGEVQFFQLGLKIFQRDGVFGVGNMFNHQRGIGI